MSVRVEARKLRRGLIVGGFCLDAKLARGGNGEVWRAVRGPDTVALKVLHRFGREPYRRFSAEVTVQRTWGRRPGILQLLDANVPEIPSDNDPPWLATPLATPVTQLPDSERTLPALLNGLLTVARTLASLHAEGIAHRDIKPSNLFLLGGEWVVGDFGLVDFPNKEALTAKGKHLGPLHYFAPEMLTDPETADGRLADVWSLAKTAFVLASAQNWPPPGSLRVDTPATRLSSFVLHERAPALDRLLERATAFAPTNRLSMQDFVAELGTISRPISGPSAVPDLSEVARLVEEAAAPARHDEKRLTEYATLGMEAYERLMSAFRPIEVSIGTANGQLGHAAVADLPALLSGELARRSVAIKGTSVRPSTNTPFSNGRTISFGTPLPTRATFACGVHLTVDDNGDVFLVGGHVVGHRLFDASTPTAGMWGDHWHAPVGSALQEEAITQLVSHMARTLPEALAAFAALIRASLAHRGSE